MAFVFFSDAMRSAHREFLIGEAEVYRVAFEKEKEPTDRALKLAGMLF